MPVPSRRAVVAWSLFLVALCAVAYANGTTGTFTYDDKAIVRDNPRIRAPERIAEIFSTPYFGGPRGSGTAYRPVLLLSYAVQWWIHGKNAFAFHAVNVLLHAAATILLGAVFLRAGVDAARSALATLFFAVAPIHVEAVTSLVGRGETLAALFTLGYVYVSLGASPRAAGRWLRVAAAMLFYGLGILTKESAAVAPALLFLFLAFRARGNLLARAGTALREGWVLYASSAAVLAGTFVLRAWVLGGMLRAPGWGIFEVENPLAPLGRAARAVNACAILLRYAGRTIFPLQLSADESAWSIRPVAAVSPVGLAAVALVAAIAILAIARFSSGSPAALGALVFGITFLPTANVLYPIGTIFGERVAYLPSAGLCLVLASAIAGPAETLAELGRSRSRRRVAAAIVLLFAGRTVLRDAVWWTDSSLFASSLSDAPDSAKAHYNWAYVRAEAGAREEALSHYTRAVRLYDRYWDAWSGKGKMERELGRLREAEASYRRALESNDSSEVAFFGLGLVCEAADRPADAESIYRRGLAKNKDSLALAYRLASVLTDEDAPGAEEAWKRALTIGPGSAATHADYAAWLLDHGREREAVLQAHDALRIDPRSADALHVLAGRTPDRGGSLGAALALEKACRISPDRDDLEALEAIAAKDPDYRARFARVRPELAKAVAREEARARASACQATPAARRTSLPAGRGGPARADRFDVHFSPDCVERWRFPDRRRCAARIATRGWRRW